MLSIDARLPRTNKGRGRQGFFDAALYLTRLSVLNKILQQTSGMRRCRNCLAHRFRLAAFLDQGHAAYVNVFTHMFGRKFRMKLHAPDIVFPAKRLAIVFILICQNNGVLWSRQHALQMGGMHIDGIRQTAE